jgi:hypothetical protein
MRENTDDAVESLNQSHHQRQSGDRRARPQCNAAQHGNKQGDAARRGIVFKDVAARWPEKTYDREAGAHQRAHGRDDNAAPVSRVRLARAGAWDEEASIQRGNLAAPDTALACPASARHCQRTPLNARRSVTPTAMARLTRERPVNARRPRFGTISNQNRSRRRPGPNRPWVVVPAGMDPGLCREPILAEFSSWSVLDRQARTTI